MKRLTVVFMAVAAFMLFAAGAAQAVTAEKATGSIIMSNPKQAIDFAVFEAPTKGSLTYTNFTYPDPGSGVWVPGSSFDVGFTLDPTNDAVYTHTLTVDSFKPLSPTSVSFKGTGFFVGGGWVSTFTGTVSGDALSLKMIEINANDPNETYTLLASGMIDTNGSITGTWSDNYGANRTGQFSTAAGAASEVFSFTTTPTCVNVTPNHKAEFAYVIPEGAPAGLAGLSVVVNVNDGGTPGAGNDKYEHGEGTCGAPVWQQNYPIVAGNLVVHN